MSDGQSGKISREERVWQVLRGAIELFIRTGKAVGSNTLKDEEFPQLSSATIRNYFAHFEELGLLSQQHASGGRIPTDLAYRWYADQVILEVKPQKRDPLKRNEGDVAAFLQEATEWISREVKGAALISTPRFDHDFVVGIKAIMIDAKRILCVLITQFGEVKSEILPLQEKMTQHGQMRLEKYFQWRLSGLKDEERPEELLEKEALLAEEMYQELMLRHIVSYAHFREDEVFRTGFSELLHQKHPMEPSDLAASLSLFENKRGLRRLLKECVKLGKITVWVGDDLKPYQEGIKGSALIATPYYIAHKSVGAIALLGPIPLPYKEWIQTLFDFSLALSKTLTEMVYKYEISYREAEIYDAAQEKLWIAKETKTFFLEDKREQNE